MSGIFTGIAEGAEFSSGRAPGGNRTPGSETGAVVGEPVG
jgi:hypothetical protein